MIILPQKMSEMKDSDATFFIELYIVKLKTGTIYLAATDTDITFDANHEMAGKELNFRIELVEVL